MNDDAATSASEAAARMRQHLEAVEDLLVQAACGLADAGYEAGRFLNGEGSRGRADRASLVEAAHDADRLHKAVRGLVEGHNGLAELRWALDRVMAADGAPGRLH